MPTLRWRRVEGVPYRWAPRGRSSASTAAVRLPWFRLGVSKMNSKANFRAAALARTLAIGLVAAPLAAVPSQPAIAQAVQNANGSLELSVGRGRLVSLPATMSDVFVANDEVADVQEIGRAHV